MARTSAAGWYPDPSDQHKQRYFDGTQWTEHNYTIGVTTPTEPGARAFRNRLLVVAGMLALSAFFVVCAVTEWHSRHSGIPARVTVTSCDDNPSTKATDWCWGNVWIDGEPSTRYERFIGPEPEDVGKTLNARVDGDGDVTITDVDLFDKLFYPVLASTFLVLTTGLAVRAVKLRSSVRRDPHR